LRATGFIVGISTVALPILYGCYRAICPQKNQPATLPTPAAAPPMPAVNTAAAPAILDRLRQMPSAELQEVLTKIKEECAEDFAAVANPGNPAALPYDIPAGKPLFSERKKNAA
jgi:hypothetical protein